MESASHQPPVGGQRGGAGLVGWVVIDIAGLLTISIQNDNVVVVPHRSAMGCGFHAVMCQSLPLLCVVVVIVRWLWLFVGQLLSFVVAVCWAVAVICCTVAVVCCAVVVVWWLGSFSVVGVA